MTGRPEGGGEAEPGAHGEPVRATVRRDGGHRCCHLRDEARPLGRPVVGVVEELGARRELELCCLRPIAGHLRGIGRVEVRSAGGCAGSHRQRWQRVPLRPALSPRRAPRRRRRGRGYHRPSIVWTTRFARGSMRDTVPSTLFATQTAPAPTAIPVGPAPTSMVAVDCPRRGIEPRDLAVSGVGDPDPGGADGDGARRVTHRRLARHDAGAVDARDGVVEVVRDPGRPPPSAMAAGSLPRSAVPSTSPDLVARRATVAFPVEAQTECGEPPIGLGRSVDVPPGGLPSWVRLTTWPKFGSMRSAVASGPSSVHTRVAGGRQPVDALPRRPGVGQACGAGIDLRDRVVAEVRDPQAAGAR